MSEELKLLLPVGSKLSKHISTPLQEDIINLLNNAGKEPENLSGVFDAIFEIALSKQKLSKPEDRKRIEELEKALENLKLDKENLVSERSQIQERTIKVLEEKKKEFDKRVAELSDKNQKLERQVKASQDELQKAQKQVETLDKQRQDTHATLLDTVNQKLAVENEKQVLSTRLFDIRPLSKNCLLDWYKQNVKEIQKLELKYKEYLINPIQSEVDYKSMFEFVVISLLFGFRLPCVKFKNSREKDTICNQFKTKEVSHV